MSRDDFLALLQSIARRPVPATAGRHVYVWQGTLEEITASAPHGLLKILDLHELCRALDGTPETDSAARRILEAAIGKWLEKEFPRDDRQRALAIMGCDLLMRYALPLSQFVQIASENRLVVMVVSEPVGGPPLRKALPPYVHFQPGATLDYFKTRISEQAFVGERS